MNFFSLPGGPRSPFKRLESLYETVAEKTALNKGQISQLKNRMDVELSALRNFTYQAFANGNS